MSGVHAPADDRLRALLAARPRIALVGASPRPERPSHSVMESLLGAGYDVTPVNPAVAEVLGCRCYPELAAIPARVDLVDVFRRADAAPDVARKAVACGARVLWLQLGVVSDAAAAIAERAGLITVMDRCTWIEHERLIGHPFAGDPPARAPDQVGLCRDCRHAREVPSARARYWLCRRSADDPSFAKYPALPMRSCRGFEWREAAAPEA
ncbi:MAG: CoA-binding protein [Candidatus Eisenbacteria bacterium]|nr:CoA-binding protein [Candidatus Eisenbacteria bacterium]